MLSRVGMAAPSEVCRADQRRRRLRPASCKLHAYYRGPVAAVPLRSLILSARIPLFRSPAAGLDQVPAVAVEVEEHGVGAILLLPRPLDEATAALPHFDVVAVEIVSVQEQE